MLGGDDLTIALFLMGLAANIGLAAMTQSHWRQPIAAGALAAALLLFVIGAAWPWVKGISPLVTTVITHIATNSVAWFVVIMFALAFALLRQRDGASARPQSTAAQGQTRWLIVILGLPVGIAIGVVLALWVVNPYGVPASALPSAPAIDVEGLHKLSLPYKQKLAAALDYLQDALNSKGISSYQTVNEVLSDYSGSYNQGRAEKLSAKLGAGCQLAVDVREGVYKETSFADPLIREIITTQALGGEKGRAAISNFSYYCVKFNEGLQIIKNLDSTPGETRNLLFPGTYDLLSDRVNQLRTYSGQFQSLISESNSRIGSIRQAL